MTERSSEFGEELSNVLWAFGEAFYKLGEFAQLSSESYTNTIASLNQSVQKEFELQMPIGLNPDQTPKFRNRKLSKEELIKHYQILSTSRLSIFGVLQLVTVTEIMLVNVVRLILLRYPEKLSINQKSVRVEDVIDAQSNEDVRNAIADHVLHEAFYGTPVQVAQKLKKLIDIDISKFSAFHDYCELTATRDVYIHNGGVANRLYEEKASNLKRAGRGENLPLDVIYFLRSLEHCSRLVDQLTDALHKKWPMERVTRFFEIQSEMDTVLGSGYSVDDKAKE